MIKAKVAISPEDITQGLMFVEDLPSSEGMLFVFSSPRRLTFWGKNTYIPLDIAFINDENQIECISEIEPHSLDAVSSIKPCTMALEVNRGFFKENNIKNGDKLEIEWGDKRNSYEALITFVEESDNISTNKYAEMVSNPEMDVGVPIGPPENEINDQQNLPIIDPSTLGEILEDSFDQNADSGEALEDTGIKPETGLEEPQTEEVQEPKKEYPVFSTAFEATEWAEQNGEVIRINYTTKKGRFLVRDVEPHGKFHAKSTQRQILVTFDETVGDIRAFIVSNIANWAFVGKHFDKKFIVKS